MPYIIVTTGLRMVSPAAPQTSYSTNFPLTESPISESGNWQNTVSGTWNHPVSTTGGHAVGLNSSGTNDSVARLVGNYLRDQTITATVFRGGSSGAAEVELHCNMTMTPGSPDQIQTYEFDFVPSSASIAIVKWLGQQGTITVLTNPANSLPTFNDGDIIKVSAIGPASARVLTAYYNGSVIATATDTSGYVTGNPGIGFDAGTPANGANLGLKSYSVVTQ